MRGDKLDDLGHLDDGGAGDCGDAKGFGDGELEALGGGEVDVEDEILVAFGADEGDGEVMDWGGKGVGEGLDGVTEGVHGCEDTWEIDRRWR